MQFALPLVDETVGFAFEIIRSPKRKKTLSLQVVDGRALLRIPQRVSDAEAMAFLREKKDWVTRCLSEEIKQPEKCYITGETWSYLGEPLLLVIEEGQKTVEWQENNLVVHTKRPDDAKAIRQQLVHWYQVQAAQLLQARTTHFSNWYGLAPQSVTVKTYKARWGACSAKGELFYNWKLVMAPPTVVDYVVVHELCHLIEMNHSKKFWHQVARALPDYKQRRKWLQQHGATLQV